MHQIEIGIQQRAGEDTDEQRRIDFLCDQRQPDGDKRRHKSPKGGAKFAPGTTVYKRGDNKDGKRGNTNYYP
jgi:hypothetical protein